MKQCLMPLCDRLLLRKRAVVETVIDQLKNISQIEHSRHRSPANCFVNLLCGLIAYCHQPKLTLHSITPGTSRIAASILLAQEAQLMPRNLRVKFSIVVVTFMQGDIQPLRSHF